MAGEPSIVGRVARAIQQAASDGQIARILEADAPVLARAAIQAMREPTINMEIAGTEAWMQRRVDLEYAGLAWRAMIDAALATEEAGG